MANVFSIAIQCDTPLQILGLVIIAIVVIAIAALIYAAVHYIGKVVLKFSKVDVDVDKGDLHTHARLRR